MNLNDYQWAASSTAIYPGKTGSKEALTYVALGLTGEAGEVANKIKKYLRDDVLNGHVVVDELGDVLWYVAAMATELGVDLGDVAIANIAKLRSRQERNVLGGNGDNR